MLHENVDIITRDFNLRDTEAQKELAACAAQWLDAWDACGASEDTRYTWDAKRNTQIPRSFWNVPRFRFDRTYINPTRGLQPASFLLIGTDKDSGTFPSDHFGILSTVSLPEVGT